jgi:hypothetical protein
VSGDEPEFWLRGPVEGVSWFPMPAAYALLQSRADLREAVGELLGRCAEAAAAFAVHAWPRVKPFR